jgi:uncharacterized protein (TIGR03089 family)
MPATSVADVLSSLHRQPGRPRLTWYGPEPERIELSGAVLDNWVTKTANLLVEELDAGPGTRVVLDLPPHWRALVWALAAWRVGACVVPVGPAQAPARDVPGDVVVTRDAAAWSGPAPVVAVALPALARRFDGDLPPGALDAASSVMTYGDALGWVPVGDPHAPAAELGDGTVTHGDLLTWAHGASGTPDGSRALLTAPADTAAGTLALLRSALDVLRGEGSLVLLAPDRDDAGVDHLARTENVTARVASDAG